MGQVTHYVSTKPKARKRHFCDLCNRVIQPGEEYRRSAGMDGSTAWTWRECAHCAQLIAVVWRETYSDDGYDSMTVDDWEPRTIAALRVKVLWRRKWARADGSLHPVPVVTWLEDKYGFGHPVDVAIAS